MSGVRESSWQYLAVCVAAADKNISQVFLGDRGRGAFPVGVGSTREPHASLSIRLGILNAINYESSTPD